jgi:hypothetical protein
MREVYDFGGIGDLGEVRDLKQHEALAAAQTTICGGGIQPPAIAATRASSDDVHPVTSASNRLKGGSNLVSVCGRPGLEETVFVLIEPGRYAKIAKIGDATDYEVDRRQRYRFPELGLHLQGARAFCALR